MILNRFLSIRASRPAFQTFILIIFTIIATLLPLFSGLGRASLLADSQTDSLLNLDFRVFVAGRPVYLILFEKDKQRLRVLKHDGKLQVIAEFAAATGENDGPKEEEGDEKTPEGVYFITKIYTDSKITIFGKRAFHLNYPNVFDEEMGKGGNGIFVHGTNKALRFKSTNGCVTLANSDLEQLVDYLALDTVPVVVVPSLHSLSGQDLNETNVRSFTFNDFERGKALMLPATLDRRQVFFESLYMVQVGRQTAVVGNYRSFAAPDALDGGFVRSYMDYDNDKGWLVKESYRQEEKLHLEPIMQAQAQMFLDSQESAVDNGESFRQFWQLHDDGYLQRYKKIASLPDIPVEPKVAQSEKLPGSELKDSARGPKDFFWLFLLTISLSIGSVWLLIRIRAKQEEALFSGIKEHVVELDETVLLAIQNDIDWIHKNLDDLQANTLLGKQAQGRVAELSKALALREEELRDKEAEFALVVHEKEKEVREQFLAKIQSMESELCQAKTVRQELEERLGKVSATEKEQRKQAEAQQKELETLREKQAQQEGREEQLKIDLGREIDSQRASLLQLEKELQGHKDEFKQLAAEKDKLQIIADQQEYKETLVILQAKYDKLVVEHQQEVKIRQHLDSEVVEQRRQLESQLHERGTELEQTRQSLQEEVELRTAIEEQLGELSIVEQELALQLTGRLQLEKELQGHKDELKRLAVEKEKLQEIADQQEHKEALAVLQTEYDKLVVEHQQELKIHQQFDAEMDKRRQLESQLHESGTELDQTRQSLQEEVERRTSLEEKLNELESLRTELAGEQETLAALNKELQKELKQRQELENKCGELSSVERELKAKIVEKEEELTEQRIALAEQHEQDSLSQEELQQQNLVLQEKVNKARLDERNSLASLAEHLKRLETVEEELQLSQEAMEALQQDNATLREIAEQAEYKEKLDLVQQQLTRVEGQLQEAAQQRARLEAQVHELAEFEKMVHKTQTEIARLSEENMELRQQLASVQVEEVVEEEAPQEDIVGPEPEEEVVIAHGDDYLPKDVLKKWIGT